jgi:lipopolysaccharide export LptBFGC system permease protein LptF
MSTRSMPRNGRSITDAERDSQSIIELVRRFSDELLTLFRQEMALATAEVSRTIRKLAAGVASIAAGAAVLYAGFLTLVAAAVLGLSRVLEPWLAALIVGGAVTIVGVVLLMVGKKTIEPEHLKPQRSVESLREDKDVLMRRAS